MIYVIRKILPVFASSILLSTLPKIICLSLNTSTSFIPYNFIHQNRQFVSAERTGNSRDSSDGNKPSAYSTITRPSPLTMSYGAWRCHGKTNSEMVEKLAMSNIIKTAPVKEALLKVNRYNYVSDEQPSASYLDAPQAIGCGQTISAPHMHAHALEEMVPTLIQFSKMNTEHSYDANAQGQVLQEQQEGLKILDVGCGSGYLTTALGRLVDRKGPISPLIPGQVFGIEVYAPLVELSKNNIRKEDQDLIDSGTVTIAQGDGWRGLPEHGPYHAIHVGAAAERFPVDLMMQLHVHGVMVIPVGPDGGVQNLYRVERVRDSGTGVYGKDDFLVSTLLGVRYVPLVHVSP